MCDAPRARQRATCLTSQDQRYLFLILFSPLQFTIKYEMKEVSASDTPISLKMDDIFEDLDEDDEDAGAIPSVQVEAEVY